MDLTPEVVFSLIQSGEEFPVDFDDAMAWWDCQTKNGTPMRRDNLLRSLLPDYCEGIDYHFLKSEEMVKRPQGGGKLMDKYYLTIDCFKMMSMQVPGERGREVRLFFVCCERELKRYLEEEKKRWQENTQRRLVSAMVSEEVVSRKRKFSDEFYELLYKKRGNGWENRDPKKNRPACVGTWTNWTVYDRLLGGTDPGGVKDALNEVNPRIDGRRKDRHHWHLKELGEFHLSSQLEVVKAVAAYLLTGTGISSCVIFKKLVPMDKLCNSIF